MRGGSERIEGEAAGRQGVAGKVHEMAVVGQQQDLRLPGEVRENGEGAGGAIVVEMDEQVVEDYGHGRVVVEELLQARDAEREVELVAGPVAHAVGEDSGSIRADADKNRLVVHYLGMEALVGAAGEIGKDGR